MGTIPITKAEMLEPFTLTCAACGSEATAYAYPLPRGSVYCPRCSPAWVESYLKFAIRQEKEEAQ